ncbi:MAG: KH domain-containing protein, partial [Bacteroidota bacterium]
MGQKVNPIGLRLGYIREWDAHWFASKKDFAEKLMEDEKIRQYLEARMAKGGIARIVIERTLKRVTITIHTARPGMAIGKGGAEVERIKGELKRLTNKE